MISYKSLIVKLFLYKHVILILSIFQIVTYLCICVLNLHLWI